MDSHRGYFGIFFATGLFLAILLQTGYDISQEGIAIMIIDAFQNSMPITNPLFSIVIAIGKWTLIIVSTIAPFFLAYYALKDGITYFIISILGLITGLATLFNPTIFVLFLIGGGVASQILDNHH